MKRLSSRSPLKDPPLRLPGQSVQEEIDVIKDQFDFNLILVVLALTLVLFAAINLLFPAPPMLIFVISCVYALGISAYAVPRMVKAIKKVKHLKQGRDGERAVAEYLDLLREDGFRVLHDIVGEGFNLDHVVISQHGIFTVETKTISKPKNGKAVVRFDGSSILIGQYSPSRDPITQAKAQASWLRNVLKQSTGKDFPVRPTIVFPGWWVEQMGKSTGSGVAVLNPKMLQNYIRKEPIFLRKEDVEMANFHLKRLIRTS